MQKTLLLALIATAVTSCNRSAHAENRAKSPNNVRKLPLGGSLRNGENGEQATRESPAVTH
ncbi:hypothetical protein VVD49_15005 [Uliginosibacterium sp. H3]|uniref:Type IV secretion system putative lipoprotein virB7 n=1 Tax=Uliginosibacterium silvisoli TaxID=3114758 RepID=A0ABU6K5N4_9RHOO|nr:hypothetical protein [Uliginosibacterium sp. H3]